MTHCCKTIFRSFLRSSVRSPARTGTTLCVSLFTRVISSATLGHQKHEWIVIVPDHPGMLQKRLQIRADHLKALHAGINNGLWKLGGAILEEVIQEGQDPKIKGSIMLAFAASKDEVLKALQEDIYFKEYVWDWQNIQIHPFKSAFRQPL